MDIAFPQDPVSVKPGRRGPDLRARRVALGLERETLAATLNFDRHRLWTCEDNLKNPGLYLLGELEEMEDFVAEETERMIEAATGEGTVVLTAVIDQDTFAAAYPEAKTLRDGVAYPLTLQHVAVGRAAGELARRGRTVEVYRGERRADLLVRRLAVGLITQKLAYELLGLQEKKYFLQEQGKSAPPAGLLKELQTIDDFIAAAASDLTVINIAGESFVQVVDDQHQFQQAYPQARTLRDAAPYPLAVLHVAAARRAMELAVQGGSSRIVAPR